MQICPKWKKKKKKKKRDWVKTQLYNSFTYYVSWERISKRGDQKKGKIILKIFFQKRFRDGMHSHSPTPPSHIPLCSPAKASIDNFFNYVKFFCKSLCKWLLAFPSFGKILCDINNCFCPTSEQTRNCFGEDSRGIFQWWTPSTMTKLHFRCWFSQS